MWNHSGQSLPVLTGQVFRDVFSQPTLQIIPDGGVGGCEQPLNTPLRPSLPLCTGVADKVFISTLLFFKTLFSSELFLVFPVSRLRPVENLSSQLCLLLS